jgi:glutathione S-transferase
VSPTGRVPVLQHAEVTVWDSLAILEYLAETFPEAQLWPEDRGARARARSVSAEMHSGFATLRQHMTLNARARLPGKGQASGVAEDIARIVALWEECRGKFGQGGPFLFGRWSAADCMFVPVVSRFQTYAVELKGAAAEYVEAVKAVPAWKEWMAAAEQEPERIEKYDQLGGLQG